MIERLIARCILVGIGGVALSALWLSTFTFNGIGSHTLIAQAVQLKGLAAIGYIPSALFLYLIVSFLLVLRFSSDMSEAVYENVNALHLLIAFGFSLTGVITSLYVTGSILTSTLKFFATKLSGIC